MDARIHGHETLRGTGVRRWSEVLALLAVWVTAGFVLRLGSIEYLLLGIPLTIAFQLFVRRQPVRAAWVRTAPPLVLDRYLVVIAVLLAIAPCVSLQSNLRSGAWRAASWSLVGVGGALGAAYALRHARRDTLRALLGCVVTAGAIGSLIMSAALLGGVVTGERAVPSLRSVLGDGGRALLLFVPITFALEEVTFRGVLDAHVRPADERGQARGAWLSAIALSALWGLWHLPIVKSSGAGWVGRAVSLVVVHTLIGVPLSLWWRRSGNLFVPAFTHALIDAVRDGLLDG